eukprot:gene22102-biopygen22214
MRRGQDAAGAEVVAIGTEGATMGAEDQQHGVPVLAFAQMLANSARKGEPRRKEVTKEGRQTGRKGWPALQAHHEHSAQSAARTLAMLDAHSGVLRKMSGTMRLIYKRASSARQPTDAKL